MPKDETEKALVHDSKHLVLKFMKKWSKYKNFARKPPDQHSQECGSERILFYNFYFKL